MRIIFAIFDIETRIDKDLVRDVMFPGENIGAQEAFDRYRAELLAQRGTKNDFFPIAFHVPISIAVGSVDRDRILTAVETLCERDYSEERLVREFWRRVEQFSGTLVSFNGRRFDLPVLELQALRYGCQAKRYFNDPRGHRYRYSTERHYDLYDFLTNQGMYSIRGGFDTACRLVGLPGKQEIDGSLVQSLWEAGRLDAIHRYCRQDVIQTYFLFLRLELLRGRVSEEAYRRAAEAASRFRGELSSSCDARRGAKDDNG